MKSHAGTQSRREPAAAEWRKVRLGEIADWAPNRVPLATLTPKNYFSTENMLKDRGGICEAALVPEGGNTQGFLEGDILISNIRPYFKKIWQAKYPGGCSNDVLVVRNKQDIEPKWLYYVLSSDDFFAYDTANSGGGKMPRGSKQAIMNFPILLPPLPIQQCIAKILGAYDDLIENNRRRIALLENMARELYRELFVRRAGECRKKQIKTAEEWFGNISIGKTPPRKETEHFNGEVPWVSIADMGKEGMFVFETAEGLARESIDNLHVKLVPAKTLLLSFKLTVGRVSITTQECCTNEAIAHFKVPETLLPYMYFNLAEYEYQKLGNTCAISNGINSKIVKKMPIALPDDALLKDYNSLAIPVFDAIFHLALQNRSLARQRDALLPRLMSGKMDFKELEKEVS